MISLKRLKEVFDWHFAPPFLSRRLIKTEWVKEGKLLNIRISRRDIDINTRGDIEGSGTFLTIKRKQITRKKKDKEKR